MKFHALALLALLVLTVQPAWSMLPPPPVTIRYDVVDLSGKQRPADFIMHADADIGDGASCVVGSDEAIGDGIARAAVYHVDKTTGLIVWNRSCKFPVIAPAAGQRIALSPRVRSTSSIQRDVTSPFEPPQTMLSVARLDARTGELLAGGHANPPSIDDLAMADARLSTWVKQGPGQIRLQDGIVSIRAETVILPSGARRSRHCLHGSWRYEWTRSI